MSRAIEIVEAHAGKVARQQPFAGVGAAQQAGAAQVAEIALQQIGRQEFFALRQLRFAQACAGALCDGEVLQHPQQTNEFAVRRQQFVLAAVLERGQRRGQGRAQQHDHP